ncbi:carboxypeptidase regulatory-like domain-containing protein [Paludibaculum fermentans]|uniref:carboxypeptidase regulatory-like domain-containing protein n=1 Tax=Paludibaculum fermentans TaxID=1473598 RepID=UPI003EBABF88
MIARLAILLLSVLPPALACSCAAPTPACQRIDGIQYAFLGRVLATNETKDAGGGPYWYRFGVDEAFKGIGPEVRELIVDPDSFSSCRRSFELGRLYLIVGRQSPLNGLAGDAAKAHGALGGARGVPLTAPIVSAGQCTGTKLAEYATEDLKFLRKYRSGHVQPSVYGSVRIHADEQRWEDRLPGLPGTFLHLTGAGQEQTVTAGADGRFEISGVAPGTYELTASAPGYFPASPEYEVNVPDRGCGFVNIGMFSQGSFTGVVTKPDGSPAPDVSVEYRYASAEALNRPLPLRSTRTNDQGEFFFPTVPPGDYHLGVHLESAPSAGERITPAYWPGVASASEAGIIHLALNEQKSGLRLPLGPAAKLRYVKLRVLWPDGRLAVNTRVYAQVRQEISAAGRTDESGVATLTLLNGVDYTLSAMETYNFRKARPYGYEVDTAEAGPVPLPAGSDQVEFSLVLQKRESGQ